MIIPTDRRSVDGVDDDQAAELRYRPNSLDQDETEMQMNLTDTAAGVAVCSLTVGVAAAALALAFGPVSFDPERTRSGGGRRVLSATTR